ncbi:MAG: hypothetical protein DU429_06865 [Candidatus Tokpelaia sp.]|nr:MAG: hypothetical protein DU430_07300 [Candidatus Tokpelaia sp.]KAA6206135.1 MAG: hypothetical protein DU429_06865 [Candidatus Tokpelaia sp.]
MQSRFALLPPVLLPPPFCFYSCRLQCPCRPGPLIAQSGSGSAGQEQIIAACRPAGANHYACPALAALPEPMPQPRTQIQSENNILGSGCFCCCRS